MTIVISVLILFPDGLTINTLPVSQFPSVAPPIVVVAVSYPGASANVLGDSVLIILEQAIKGVQDLRHMASAAHSAGELTAQRSQADLIRATLTIKPLASRRTRVGCILDEDLTFT